MRGMGIAVVLPLLIVASVLWIAVALRVTLQAQSQMRPVVLTILAANLARSANLRAIPPCLPSAILRLT
jgi:hypothetical protein